MFRQGTYLLRHTIKIQGSFQVSIFLMASWCPLHFEQHLCVCVSVCVHVCMYVCGCIIFACIYWEKDYSCIYQLLSLFISSQPTVILELILDTWCSREKDFCAIKLELSDYVTNCDYELMAAITTIMSVSANFFINMLTALYIIRTCFQHACSGFAPEKSLLCVLQTRKFCHNKIMITTITKLESPQSLSPRSKRPKALFPHHGCSNTCSINHQHLI